LYIKKKSAVPPTNNEIEDGSGTGFWITTPAKAEPEFLLCKAEPNAKAIKTIIHLSHGRRVKCLESLLEKLRRCLRVRM
jgi:hypothetical protein